MNLAWQILRRLRTEWPRTIKLNGHSVRLPPRHRLDWHRLRHSRYDEPVADLATLLVQKFGDVRIIDIGANVGDTAALMAQSDNVSILCVEGNPEFLPLLRENLGKISPNSEIAPYFVGFSSGETAASLVTRHGSAAITLDEASGSKISMIPLREIIERYPKFSDARLIKTDTDGFDAKIILSSIDVVSKIRPILHIEYTPFGGEDAESECIEMMQGLLRAGYIWFHIFDNFGNQIIRLSADEISHMKSLNAYVKNTRRDLRPAIFYYDVCAITDDDTDVSEALLAHYVEAAPLRIVRPSSTSTPAGAAVS